MLDSEKLAIAAHLHVLLRRKAGRVTDTEWLATNTEYAKEIIRFTRTKAVEDGHTDLAEWAEKLEQAFASGPAVRPVGSAPAQTKAVVSLTERLRGAAPTPAPALALVAIAEDSHLPPDSSFPAAVPEAEKRYIGRLR